MEPESSLPYSQVPATCPYPEPTPSGPHNPLPLPKDPSQCYPPIYVWVSPVALYLRFPHQNPVHTSPLPSPIRATCPAPLILLDFTTHTILGKEYRSLSSSLCNFFHYYLVHLTPKYPPQHPILNTLSLRSSLNVSDQVSHPYRTMGKIIILYIS